MVTFNFTAFKKYLISDFPGVKQDFLWQNLTYREHNNFYPGKYAVFKRGN